MKARVVLGCLCIVLAVAGLIVPWAAAQSDPPAESGDAPGVLTGGVITPEHISAPQIIKTPIAIPLFKDENGKAGDAARQLADVLTDDLETSGEFEVIDRARYLEDPNVAGVKAGEFEMSDWSLIGAEYVVKSAITREDDRIKLAMRLFNVGTGSMLVGKEYAGTYEERFKMVHLFAGEIFQELRGDRGFFGSQIAFASGTKSLREIYVMDADGRNRRRLTNLGLLAMSPRWSHDGKKIVFAAVGDTAPSGLYLIDVRSGNIKRIFEAKSGVVITPEWTPDGNKIAVALSHDGNGDIYEVDLNGNIGRNLTKHWSIDLAPAYSPNGRQMLFISDRPGAPQVYKSMEDGSDPARISYFGSYNQSPAWSKRGGKIAYSAREFGHYTIYLIDENLGEPYALTADMAPSCEFATFSPDGRVLVFSCETAKGRALWLRTTNDSFTKRMTQGTAYDTDPAWGPVPTE